MVRKRLRELKYSKELINDVSQLVFLPLRFHGYGKGEWTDSAVRRYVTDAGPLLSRLPALGAATEGKETRFLSAANPLAREYVFGLLDELAGHYDIDGLLLDYIRYDEEIPEDDTSKTRFAL